MQAVRNHPSLEWGKAYDVVVVVEVSAADLRKAAQADRTSKGVTTRRQKVTAAEHTGLAVSAVGTMLANLAGIIVSVLSR
jgi:hypothetical protein